MLLAPTLISMLEIGALRPDNYKQTWITNYPIDLHSQHPDILEQDFMQRPTDLLVDVISASLVLNFVESPQDRGELCRATH